MIQFAEQAVQVEAETDTLIKKQFGQGTVGDTVGARVRYRVDYGACNDGVL